VIEFEPDGSVDVPKLAMPTLRVAVPNTVVPFLNVTVPVGVPLAAVTVAVKITRVWCLSQPAPGQRFLTRRSCCSLRDYGA
jgi:hypothetical protein